MALLATGVAASCLLALGVRHHNQSVERARFSALAHKSAGQLGERVSAFDFRGAEAILTEAG